MKVHELLDAPEKWTKKAYARDAHGNDTPAESRDAVCWCLLGAIRKCYGQTATDPDNRREEAIRFRVQVVLPAITIPGFNDRDDMTFAQVRKLALDLDI